MDLRAGDRRIDRIGQAKPTHTGFERTPLGIALPRAMLFDMDGTLTEPLLDYPRIKRDMGLDPGQPILESMRLLAEDRRADAAIVLLRHEDDAAERSTLNPGCVELLGWLEARAISVALVTRNTKRSVEIVTRRHGLRFAAVVTRDDCAHKPDPAPLHMACERLGQVPVADAWMVGDSIHDVQAGLAAGMRTVWLSHGSAREFHDEPWQSICTLTELRELLESAEPCSPADASGNVPRV